MKKLTDHEIESEIRRLRAEKGADAPPVSPYEVRRRLGSGDIRRIARLIERLSPPSESPPPLAAAADGDGNGNGNGNGSASALNPAETGAAPSPQPEPPALPAAEALPDPGADPAALQRRLATVETRLDLLTLENRALHEDLARERALRQNLFDRLVDLIDGLNGRPGVDGGGRWRTVGQAQT